MNKMFVIRERLVPVIPVSGHVRPTFLPPHFSVGELLRERGSWHQKEGIIREKPGIIHIFPPFLRRKIQETNSANYGHDRVPDRVIVCRKRKKGRFCPSFRSFSPTGSDDDFRYGSGECLTTRVGQLQKA